MEAVALESSQSVKLSQFNVAQPFLPSLPSPPSPHSSSMIPLLLFGCSATCVQATLSPAPFLHHVSFCLAEKFSQHWGTNVGATISGNPQPEATEQHLGMAAWI